jgi:hypothetical protein
MLEASRTSKFGTLPARLNFSPENIAVDLTGEPGTQNFRTL